MSAPGVSTYVFSHDPAASKPVATTSHATGAIQWMHLTDAASPGAHASVLSYAAANPVAVALTGPTGAHLTVLSVNVGNTIAATVTGSVLASQGGAPWTFTGSVGASQLGAPWTVVASVIGQPTITASVVGQITVTASLIGVPSFVGSVQATQATSPWVTLPGSSGATFATVASIQGTPAVVGSVNVTQASSPWVTRAGSSGAVHLVTGSIAATQVGSWLVGVLGTNGLQAGVSSYGGDGNLLRVDLVRGTLSAGADGALLDGADSSIKARVASLSGGGMLYVFVASQAGGGSTVTGSVVATQGGAPWTFTGSVGATQLGAPWTVIASVIGQPTVTASIAGTPSVVASIIGVPTFVGSVATTPAGSLNVGLLATSGTTVGLLTATSDGAGPLLRVDAARGTVVASVIGTATVVASCIGQQTVTASLVGVPTFVGSVLASQGGAPWSWTGSAAVTPAASWSVLMLASSGTTVGPLSVTSNAGGALLRTEMVQGSLGVTQLGSPWGVVGSVGVTPLAAFSVTGTVVASVIGQPTVTASVIGTIAASITGTVVASVIGQPTVTASVIGVPTVVASVIGQPTVTASIAGTIAASVTGTVVASVIGQPTVTASVVGNPTVVASLIGTATVVTSQVFPHLRMRAILTTASSLLAHPFDGATAQVRSSTAAGSSTVWLATDVWTGDLRGFAIMFTSSGDAQGQVRTIASLTSSLIATVDSPWVTGQVPASGQTYRLLVDARNIEMATVATELSSSTATVWGTIAQYTVPQSGTATVKPVLDSVRLWDNLQTSLEVFQSSYWQGQARALLVRGAVGFKWIVTSIAGTASGATVSAWAGAS